jgi:predicted adenine nucleotide alpha hydrolase (AANH) superfamily ATPase
MEITIKVAIEDLEKSIENRYSKKLDDLLDVQENKNSEKLILEYFRNNLTLSPDKNTKVYQWVGKELSDNLHDIYLYFEIPNYDKNENVESITIKNTLFLDLYDYQTNIVLIELIDRKYNLTFTIDNDIQTILMNKVR